MFRIKLVNNKREEWSREKVRQAEVVKPTMRNNTNENILNMLHPLNKLVRNSCFGVLSQSHGEKSVHESKVL